MKAAYKVLGLFLTFALGLACGESAAQSYPTKPITFVVGFLPGGGRGTGYGRQRAPIPAVLKISLALQQG